MTGPMAEEYLTRYVARHEAPVTRGLTFVGDLFYVGGPVLGALVRRPRVAILGLGAGAVVTAAAHLFQPGTLLAELRATAGHPVWAARAELMRLRSRPTVRSE